MSSDVRVARCFCISNETGTYNRVRGTESPTRHICVACESCYTRVRYSVLAIGTSAITVRKPRAFAIRTYSTRDFPYRYDIGRGLAPTPPRTYRLISRCRVAPESARWRHVYRRSAARPSRVRARRNGGNGPWRGPTRGIYEAARIAIWRVCGESLSDPRCAWSALRFACTVRIVDRVVGRDMLLEVSRARTRGAS